MKRKDKMFLDRLSTRNKESYTLLLRHIQKIFHQQGEKLREVKEIAEQLNINITKIIPLIEPVTQMICSSCQSVCCIRKHGFFNKEDLIYFSALGVTPPNVIFDGEDEDPCQFLSHNGCILERSFRPSGCNWFFCDTLLDQLEKTDEFLTFDDSFSRLAELWVHMMENFSFFEHESLKP